MCCLAELTLAVDAEVRSLWPLLMAASCKDVGVCVKSLKLGFKESVFSILLCCVVFSVTEVIVCLTF